MCNVVEINFYIIENSKIEQELKYIRKNSEINLSPEDIEILKIFKFGIPCHSHILPDSIKNNKIVQTRPNEMLTSYCKVKINQQLKSICLQKT